jgi:hypothetical protein
MNGYFERAAYPASTIPYTPSETIPNVYRMPTSRSARTMRSDPSREPKGMTAIVTRAGTIASAGASQKYTLRT